MSLAWLISKNFSSFSHIGVVSNKLQIFSGAEFKKMCVCESYIVKRIMEAACAGAEQQLRMPEVVSVAATVEGTVRCCTCFSVPQFVLSDRTYRVRVRPFASAGVLDFSL